MFTNRLFTLFVVLTLVVIVVLTIQQLVPTKTLSSNPNQVHSESVKSSLHEVTGQHSALPYRRGEWYCIDDLQPMCRK